MRLRSIAILALGLYGCASDGSNGTDSIFGGTGGTGGAVQGNAAGGAGAMNAGQGTGGTSSSGTFGGTTSTGAATGGGNRSGSSNGPGGAPGTAGGGTPNGPGGTPGTSSGGTSSGGVSSGAGGASGGNPSNGGASAGGSGGATSGTRWKPAKNTTFFWDLQNAPPDNTRNVGAYDIDGWNNDAQEVAALHAKGIKVVCYMDAGTYEPGRPDDADFPASLKGADVQGWPGELWLDVRPSGPNYAKLQQIMQARFTQCQMKGFDAVEPDNIDSYQNSPGFSTTAADQLAYNEWLATTAHGLGLAIFQKNDLDQVKQLESYFDGILDEECNKYSECDTLAPYTSAGKPAWDAEYTEDGESTAKFCSADISANIVGALFGLDLDGKLFEPCSNDVGKIN